MEIHKDNLFDFTPNALSVTTLPAVPSERFAIKVSFDNGEIRKYVLPIDNKFESDEVVKYRNHIFTDDIWNTAEITTGEEDPSFLNTASICDTAIQFKNGYRIPGMTCYLDGTAYSEPVICDTEVYNDGHFLLQKKWQWNVTSIHEDKETGLFKVLLSGLAYNGYGKSTFVSPDGRRLISLDFDYIDDFHEGLAAVCVVGRGYGYIDSRMHFVIPMRYDYSDEFRNGKAKVQRDGIGYYIDKAGNETALQAVTDARYQEVGLYSEGLCRVSTLKLGYEDLAYYSDYEEIAGIWGFVNEAGEEVIPPQFIYAHDFKNGMAIVCKGKWTIDKKWDNEYSQGLYWTDKALWGAIDAAGHELIPCIFDEIKFFGNAKNVFMAHFSGWKNGHWGVIDNRGNWLAEPVFENIAYEYSNGLFAFYGQDERADGPLMGIYDINQKKVVFEPQFQNVSFCDDGYTKVTVFDEELGRTVERIIDINGKEKFHSEYSSIYTWKRPYEVVIHDAEGFRHGLIDEDGSVIQPCIYDVAWNGISYEKKRIVFEKGGKQGIMDFDENIIVEPIYYEIYGMSNPLLTVRVGERDNYKEGLITPEGIEVLPAVYSSIQWCSDNRIICCHEDCCEVYRFFELL